MTTQRTLFSSWKLFYHHHDDNNWKIDSFDVIMTDINTVEKVVALHHKISDDMIRYSMLFFMLHDINPVWEDKKNKNGGCFSYKVTNKLVPNIWRDLMSSLCGHTLTKNKEHMNHITGITISPKKNFCIIKIWLNDCSLQDSTIIADIDNLPVSGCIFRKHF